MGHITRLHTFTNDIIYVFLYFWPKLLYMIFQILMRNHSYSWGPMFVDCQSPAISRESNSWVTVLLDYSARQFIIRSWGHKLTPEIHEHWSPERTMMIPHYSSIIMEVCNHHPSPSLHRDYDSRKKTIHILTAHLLHTCIQPFFL